MNCYVTGVTALENFTHFVIDTGRVSGQLKSKRLHGQVTHRRASLFVCKHIADRLLCHRGRLFIISRH